MHLAEDLLKTPVVDKSNKKRKKKEKKVMKKSNLNCLNIGAGAFGGRFIFLRIRSRLSNCRTLAQPPLFDTDLLLILIIILLQFFANMVTWFPLVTGPTPQPPSHHCHH